MPFISFNNVLQSKVKKERKESIHGITIASESSRLIVVCRSDTARLLLMLLLLLLKVRVGGCEHFLRHLCHQKLVYISRVRGGGNALRIVSHRHGHSGGHY